MKVVRIDGRVAALPATGGIAAVSASGERARLMMRDARAAAIEHLESLETSIRLVRDLSLDVAHPENAYGVGVRDLAGRLAEDLLWRGKGLSALMARERAGLLAR